LLKRFHVEHILLFIIYKMLIKGNYIDLFKREIYPLELELREGRIGRTKRLSEEVEAYILPGFIDAHVHIESSMLIPEEFAKEAARHGTVGVVSDPHEIANVLGMEGIEYMLENGKEAVIKFFFGAPSCVPATEFETSGARLDPGEIEQLLKREDIYFLSEMMNYPGVINSSIEVMEKLAIAKRFIKPVDGHAPGVRGEDLKKYIDAGISTDHEAFTLEEAREKIERGMKILIREGSAARNLEALAPLYDTNPDMLMLCSDDIHPEMLRERHINGLVKELVSRGYDLYDVLRSASINPIRHYNLSVGCLREGDSADFIIINNPVDFEVRQTWVGGRQIYPLKPDKAKKVKGARPNRFECSSIKPGDLAVANMNKNVRVIEVSDGELYTTSTIEKWSDKEYLGPDTGRDILKLVVKDRYRDRPASIAFIRGFGIKRGAIASSVAHDSHNIIALGTDDKTLADAINSVVSNKGGLVVCCDGNTNTLPLPVAGIMSDVPCGTIAEKYLDLSDKVKAMGSYLKAPFMTLSFMSLLVIPELKLGDRGLFDGINFEFTDLFVDEA